MMNNKTNNMVGGGDSSSTSTTSDVPNNPSVEQDKKSKYDISSANTDISGGEFSYESSSAHTSGDASSNVETPAEPASDEKTVNTDTKTSKVESDSKEEDEKKEKKSDSAKTTEQSEDTLAENSNADQHTSSSSIRTSDINMISINTE